MRSTGFESRRHPIMIHGVMVAHLTLTQMDQVQILMDHQVNALLVELADTAGLDPVLWGFESLTGYICGSRQIGKVTSLRMRSLKVRILSSVQLCPVGGTGRHSWLRPSFLGVRIPHGVQTCSWWNWHTLQT